MTEGSPRFLSFARVFSIACTLLALPLAPMLFLSPGTFRQHPLPLAAGERRIDGSIVVRQRGNPDIRVTEVRVADGPWLPAGSTTIGRALRNLPPGTRIAYKAESSGRPRIIDRAIAEVRAGRDMTATRLVQAVLAVFFLIAGVALAIGGQNRASLYAAGFIAGAGSALGNVFLEPAVVRISSQSIRDVVIAVSDAVPSMLWAYYLLAFITVFPTALTTSRLLRLVRVVIASLAIARAAFLASAQVAPLFDALPWRAQFTIIALLERNVLQNACYLLCSVAGIHLLVRQSRALRASATDLYTARRARIVIVTVITGFAPTLAAILIQVISLILRRQLLFSKLEMSLLLVPMALVPMAVCYALLARRVHTVGIVARRAALFAVAENTLAGAALLPLAAIVWFTYPHRKESLESVFFSHPVALTLAILAAVAALRFARAGHDALERLFFRERRDARNVLRALADKSRRATSVTELRNLLIGEIDGAFHLESIALFTRDVSGESFVAADGALPPIDSSSTIVSLLNQSHEILDAALGLSRRALRNVSELERHWLAEGQVRLIVPLIASDGSLLAFLALGEKMDELPFTADDRALLAAVAASAALVFENHLLRGTQVPAAIPPSDAGEPERIALRCPQCRRLYSPLLRTKCPDDDMLLTPAEAPYLLAGKYRFEAEIGAGGMGVVYRARDLSLGRSVAVKTLPRVSTETLARLRREARAAANLSHPNLATIYAAESWHGVPMLVFELLDGGTLRERLTGPRLPVRAVIDIGIQLCDALETAHSFGILHRDIKPANVGFTSSGVPKLLDFGLAKFLEISIGETGSGAGGAPAGDATSSATGSSGLLGTPSYLSPEAVLGEPIHPDFDVWSLTVTLYEAITGSNPFSDPSPTKAMNAILNGKVPGVSTLRPDCPERLATVLQDCLARERGRRPHSANELRERLAAAVA